MPVQLTGQKKDAEVQPNFQVPLASAPTVRALAMASSTSASSSSAPAAAAAAAAAAAEGEDVSANAKRTSIESSRPMETEDVADEHVVKQPQRGRLRGEALAKANRRGRQTLAGSNDRLETRTTTELAGSCRRGRGRSGSPLLSPSPSPQKGDSRRGGKGEKRWDWPESLQASCRKDEQESGRERLELADTEHTHTHTRTQSSL
ncbi:unnamed protein product [Protopolystoma xenopodis]|uniref:Uncharacterized protein n=1 Tax=Protopolystoma xenopodis TaxID=117903 RepID=A0A448X402_9PLAT|nr:unnamed protein product [Protopolystoma xenopodis]